MFNMNVCAPTVADDMILVSLSRKGLEKMMSICHNYSVKWRFEYNANKCGVIVFNETGNRNTERRWKLGPQTVNEVVEYTHLGINCNSFLSTKKSIQDACIKLRGTYISVLNSGFYCIRMKLIHLL